MGGRMFAAEGIPGDLAELTPWAVCMPDAMAGDTVVFRVGGDGLPAVGPLAPCWVPVP